jgi:hypothetical protein
MRMPGFSAEASLHRNFESYSLSAMFKRTNEIIEPAYFHGEIRYCVIECFDECMSWLGMNKNCLRHCLKHCRDEPEFPE